MNMIHNLFKDDYDSDSFCEICPIQIKKYFDFKDKDLLFNEFIPNLNYNTRGLYFVPIQPKYAKILYLFKENELKQKKKDTSSTLIFKIQKTLKRDVYDLYLQGPNNIVKHGIACVPNLKCSQMLRELFNNFEDINIECKYNHKFKKWQPIKKTSEPVSLVSDV